VADLDFAGHGSSSLFIRSARVFSPLLVVGDVESVARFFFWFAASPYLKLSVRRARPHASKLRRALGWRGEKRESV